MVNDWPWTPGLPKGILPRGIVRPKVWLSMSWIPCGKEGQIAVQEARLPFTVPAVAWCCRLCALLGRPFHGLCCC